MVATDPSQILRLVYSVSGGFALTLDIEQEGDQVIESEGRKVLLIGPDVASMAAGAVIDIQETEEGPRLTISR